jgi:hypothetical protein
MPPNKHHEVRITAPAAAGPQSRVRKQFNTLIKKLDAERARLALWRDEVPKIRSLADTELTPLVETFADRRRQLIVTLDLAWSGKRVGKKERDKISDLICVMVEEALLYDEDDPELKAIYDRHSKLALGLGSDEEQQFMRNMVAAATGIELDEDADLSSPSALRDAMQRKVEAMLDAEDAEHASHAGQAKSAKSAKAAKPSAREARRQAEEKKLQQSVRDIFRKLASALHPDRETDPAERARKTTLMQRVNVAYAANDLLGLLELQLEIEQIDQASLDKLDDDRIAQYNRILTSQMAEIQDEIMTLEMVMALDMNLEPGAHRTPKALMGGLRAEIQAMKADLELIEGDIVTFSDVKTLKAWLKDYQIGANAPNSGEPWF